MQLRNTTQISRIMRYLLSAAALFALAVPAHAQRESLGIFGRWGAFHDKNGSRCFAITEPQRQSRNPQWKPFASVGDWPARQARGQVYFRLSRIARPGSVLLLRIDDRSFQLVGRGADAWAPDARADGEIVRAMRSGISMTLAARSERGGLIRDSYQLRGAATAIDAAAIACARRG